jgi:hypothetical protein
MMASFRTFVAVSMRTAIAVFLLFALSVPSVAKSPLRQAYYETVCRTGWWMVRDGHRYWRPSDGMWRPTWATRCFRVIVRQ